MWGGGYPQDMMYPGGASMMGPESQMYYGMMSGMGQGMQAGNPWGGGMGQNSFTGGWPQHNQCQAWPQYPGYMAGGQMQPPYGSLPAFPHGSPMGQYGPGFGRPYHHRRPQPGIGLPAGIQPGTGLPLGMQPPAGQQPVGQAKLPFQLVTVVIPLFTGNNSSTQAGQFASGAVSPGTIQGLGLGANPANLNGAIGGDGRIPPGVTSCQIGPAGIAQTYGQGHPCHDLVKRHSACTNSCSGTLTGSSTNGSSSFGNNGGGQIAELNCICNKAGAELRNCDCKQLG